MGYEGVDCTVILQIHEYTNIRKYSEKGRVKDMNEGTKIRNMKHKINKKKRREMRKENEINCKLERND